MIFKYRRKFHAWMPFYNIWWTTQLGFESFASINLLHLGHAFTFPPKKSGYPSSRDSFQEVFRKRGVLKNFVKFTGKHLYWSFFCHKAAGLRPVKNRVVFRTQSNILQNTPSQIFDKVLNTPMKSIGQANASNVDVNL